MALFALHLPPSLFQSSALLRVHWAIVIVAVIGTILLTWHIRTQHLDFMTPRGAALAPEDYGENLAVKLIPPQPVIEETPKGSEVLGNPEAAEEDIVVAINDADLGDFDTSPGLAAYQDFAKRNKAAHLIELSSTLHARGQLQRALLALERVIDSSEADAATLEEAAQGIQDLAPTLPPWNIDPTTEISLMLQLGTAHRASESLKAALLEVAALIKTSSSDLLKITPTVTSNRSEKTIDDSPVTIWISSSDKKPISTPVISFKISAEQEGASQQIALAVFKTIRSQLSSIGYAYPPSLSADGKDLLSTYISRLMWRDFAHSLYRQSDPKTESASPSN